MHDFDGEDIRGLQGLPQLPMSIGRIAYIWQLDKGQFQVSTLQIDCAQCLALLQSLYLQAGGSGWTGLRPTRAWWSSLPPTAQTSWTRCIGVWSDLGVV